jgi:hypothetical protein
VYGYEYAYVNEYVYGGNEEGRTGVIDSANDHVGQCTARIKMWSTSHGDRREIRAINAAISGSNSAHSAHRPQRDP